MLFRSENGSYSKINNNYQSGHQSSSIKLESWRNIVILTVIVIVILREKWNTKYEIRNTKYGIQETGDEGRETGNGIIWYAVRDTFCMRMRMRCGRNKRFGSGHVACMYQIRDQFLVVIFVLCLDQPKTRRRPEKEKETSRRGKKERENGRKGG